MVDDGANISVRPWGIPVAVPGEFSWPSLGNPAVRPWGIPVAAYGDFRVSADTPPTLQVRE